MYGLEGGDGLSEAYTLIVLAEEVSKPWNETSPQPNVIDSVDDSVTVARVENFSIVTEVERFCISLGCSGSSSGS